MTNAERRFKECVTNLVNQNIYPSGQAIQKILKGYSLGKLNGRECQWRREICKVIGFKLKGRNL